MFTRLSAESLKSYQCPPAGMCIEKVLNLVGGSDDGRKRFLIQIVDKKKRKFDLLFYSRLEHHFPDWNDRSEYQRKQEKLYDSAMKKRREALRLRLKENWNRTTEEQDAIDSFAGTGF
jgi:hypothetical protein